MTNVVTGHRQTFGTSSDVLAQQFATQVGRTIHRIFRALPHWWALCSVWGRTPHAVREVVMTAALGWVFHSRAGVV